MKIFFIFFILIFCSVHAYGLGPRSIISPDEFYLPHHSSRKLAALNRTYGIERDLRNLSQMSIVGVLLIGVGRGYAALEISLKHPNVRILGINKERGLWNPGETKNYFLQEGYSQREIEQALDRIEIVEIDLSNEENQWEVLRNRKFDFIIFEIGVLEYFRNKIGTLENLYNRHLKKDGVFAFNTNFMTTESEESARNVFDGLDFMGSKRSRVTEIICQSFKGKAKLKLKRFLAPVWHLKFIRQNTREISIPLSIHTETGDPVGLMNFQVVSIYREGRESLIECNL